MRRTGFTRMIVLGALLVTGPVGCETPYEKETPFGQSKWSAAISSIGQRIREEKPVTMRMMREKFGQESLTRPLGDDRTQAGGTCAPATRIRPRWSSPNTTTAGSA